MSWSEIFTFTNVIIGGGGGTTQRPLEKLWKDSLFMLFTQARPGNDYEKAQNVSYKTNEKARFNKEIAKQ